MALVEISDDLGVITITLNDPGSRNAMSEAMAEEFRGAVERLKLEEGIRVVILTGAGEVFSGGGHLAMLEEKTRLSVEENEQKMLEFYRSFLSVCDLPVPTIAALNGHAIGAGCCLSLACDIRIAAEGAKLGFNFLALGLHPGMGATYFLPRIIGPAKAAELLYSAAIISAKEAFELGMVNRVVRRDLLGQAVGDLAKRIASNGPCATRELKQSLRQAGELDEALAREAQVQANNYVGREFLEGISAARERRTPVFPTK
jgi:enoyl-CoA hydratase